MRLRSEIAGEREYRSGLSLDTKERGLLREEKHNQRAARQMAHQSPKPAIETLAKPRTTSRDLFQVQHDQKIARREIVEAFSTLRKIESDVLPRAVIAFMLRYRKA